MQGGPVFLVGSVRSGSTALAGALLAAGFAGHNEGHLHPLFPALLGEVDRFYSRHWQFATPGNLLHQVPRPAFRGALIGFIRRYMDEFYGGRRWMEKTVNLESLKSVSGYLEIWPDAFVIFPRRHPLDILASRLVKFPQHSFEYHCRDLSEILSFWLNLREKLPRALELEQTRMATRPGDAAADLGRFLGLTEQQVATIAHVLRSRHPEKTATPLDRAALLEGPRRAAYEAAFAPLQEKGGFALYPVPEAPAA